MASVDFLEAFEKKTLKIIAVTVYGFLELVLMTMIFCEGLFSFAANEFACCFGLKFPCLFCSRLDHLIFRRDPEFFYRDSICQAHSKDISMLGYCHIHMNLSDVRWMCADCLLSFLLEKKSNSEVYRSLVSILGTKLENLAEEDHRREEDTCDVRTIGARRCSCCRRPLRRSRGSFTSCHVSETSAGQFDRVSSLMSLRDKEFRRSVSNISSRDLRFASDGEMDYISDENWSLLLDIEADIDDLLGIRKFNDSPDSYEACGSISEDAQSDNSERGIVPIELPRAWERSMWLGLDAREGRDICLMNGAEDFSWDREMSPPLSDSSALSLRDNSRDATMGTAGFMGNGDRRWAEYVDLYDIYRIAMTKKLSRTDDLSLNKGSRPSSPSALPFLRNRKSVERNKSLESWKRRATKEQKQNLLQRLRQQIHLDRQYLIALSVELDQERNASAVAANEAMAMITRLQEQKAAVQLEASHYQRLMDEQVEYDQEILEVMKHLLIKRERKIKDLEAEVKKYKDRFDFDSSRNESDDDLCEDMTMKHIDGHEAVPEEAGISCWGVEPSSSGVSSFESKK